MREKERLCNLHEFGLNDILASLERPSPTNVRGLNPASTAILIAELYRTQKRPLVILASDDAILTQLRDNLGFFSKRAASEAVLVPEIQAGIYSGIAQNRRQVAARMHALHRMHNDHPRIVMASFNTAARKCIPKPELEKNTFLLRTHETCEPSDLKKRLLELGYAQAQEVDTSGTFAMRGGIMDVFSPAHPNAIRIEFFGDEIEEIRSFDADSQKTIEKRADAIILPASEIILSTPNIERAVANMSSWADELEWPSQLLRLNREKVDDRVLFWGIQALMPSYYDQTASLLEYFEPNAVYLWLEPDLCIDTLHKSASLLEKQYQHALDDKRLVAPPHEHVISSETICDFLHQQKILYSGLALEFGANSEDFAWFDSLENTDLIAQRRQMSAQRSEDFLKVFAEYLAEWETVYGEIAIVAHSSGMIERIKTMFRPLSIPVTVMDRPFNLIEDRQPPAHGVHLYQGNLSSGCRHALKSLAIITESDLFGAKTHRSAAKKLDDSHVLTSFRDLKAGDYVVHADHGIGQYQGLVTLTVGGITGDFLHIVYAEAGKLYIPVQRLKSVQKYAGAEKPTRLDKLGGGAWERTKEKVRQNVKKLAIDLIDLYARRQSRSGFAFSERDPFFQAFEDDFPYEETPDQAKAIESVLEDMHKPRPMERLICGDVGFGKTEVAMRAAMRAVLDGKQVAVLVPTTILAEQHYENFIKRFEGHPVTIESLNRFRKPKQIKQILADLAIGKVDIVIGTHRLLSKDVVFKSLGLLIVDEEHRFGVAHKERIKTIAEGVDCLTMTATPIPRTFQMCLGGLKDLSVIETPPSDRLAIHTLVAKMSDSLIAEAIENELGRGGQVYFLHNRVEELPEYFDRIQRLVPKAKIVVAHGQMDEKDLESAMFRFIHHEVDVLLCTTIIESGIDIPSANCLIVSHAERFGLAQLYQIRGRVGRSSERAYCYLLTGKGELSDIARERLSAIERLTELGSGLEIAYLDLEMRGCGNLLGAEQSGNITAVGLDMYAELMQEAVEQLQGQATEMAIESEVNLPLSAYLSEDYISDVQMRLLFYKRMANAETIDQLYEIFGEIIDRFGPAPKEAHALKDTFELKIMLGALGIKSMDANYTSIILDLGENSRLDPAKLVSLITMHPKQYTIRQDQKLIRYLTKSESEALTETAAIYLDELKSRCY